MKQTTNKYISVYQYAKKHGTSSQNVYRWIREGKIKDFRKETLTVTRIRICDATVTA